MWNCPESARFLLLALAVALASPANAADARAKVELADPAGDVDQGREHPARDVTGVVISSDGEAIQVEVTLAKDVRTYLDGHMAGDVVELHLDVDGNAATGGTLGGSMATGPGGFEYVVKIRSCIEYENGNACAGALGGATVKGYYAAFEPSRYIGIRNVTDPLHEGFWDGPRGTVSGRALRVAIPYPELHLTEARALRIVVEESDASPFDGRKYFPEAWLALKAGPGLKASTPASFEARDFVAQSVKPTFSDFSIEKLRSSLRVVSGRGGAVFGFNVPEVRLYLPQSDNSHYAEIEMPDPELHDKAGRSVAFELQRSGYQEDSHSEELRFENPSGSELLAFARARGTIVLRYPLSMRTRRVSASEADPDVRIDGQVVQIAEGPVAKRASSFGGDTVRAFDARGRQIKKASYSGFSSDGNRTLAESGFHAPVASVEVDVVERWASVSIRYDLPPAPLLPEAKRGSGDGAPADVKETPGGKVVIEKAVVE